MEANKKDIINEKYEGDLTYGEFINDILYNINDSIEELEKPFIKVQYTYESIGYERDVKDLIKKLQNLV